MADTRRDYQERLTRLAFLVIRDRTEAEQVASDVLASGPPEGRDYVADHRAVAHRCSVIIRARKGLPPD